MTIGKYLAQQFSNPSDLIAGLVLPLLWNRRNAALNDLTLARLDLTPNESILEVGCGGGYLLGRMAQVITHGKLAGVDISPVMLAHCQKHLRRLVQAGRLELHCTSAESLPFETGSFTRACTVNAIFYFPDPAGALAELWRVLAPGGRALVTFTRLEDLQDRSFAAHGLNLFSALQVKGMLEAAGFSGVHIHDGADRHRRFHCLTGHKR